MQAASRPRQKVGLALSGGSTRGVAHVGALKALVENHIPIDCISGTSAGALVAACFAFGMPLAEMEELTRTLNWKKFSRFAFSKFGFQSSEPMGAYLTDLLGDVRIEDARIPLAIVATNIETHQMVSLRSGSLRDAIRASTCLPGFFSPIEIDGMLLVDGGLTERLPLSALTEMGATITIGVNLLEESSSPRPTNVFDVLNASLTILSKSRDAALSHKADVLIEPDIVAFDSYRFNDSGALVVEGYRAAIQAIPVIQAKLQKPEPSSTFSLWKAFFKLFE